MTKKQVITRIIIILVISLVVAIYYKEIVFKDEPKLTYVVQPISTRKGIFLEGFDTETKKNIKGAKHNTFDQNYKP